MISAVSRSMNSIARRRCAIFSSDGRVTFRSNPSALIGKGYPQLLGDNGVIRSKQKRQSLLRNSNRWAMAGRPRLFFHGKRCKARDRSFGHPEENWIDLNSDAV